MQDVAYEGSFVIPGTEQTVCCDSISEMNFIYNWQQNNPDGLDFYAWLDSYLNNAPLRQAIRLPFSTIEA